MAAAGIRQYDLVLFGATGYTGKLTAEYIAKSSPTDLKWAISGRSATKLEAVAAECKTINPDRMQPAIEICNLNDAELSELSRKTTVLISTVGPYSKYGEHAFKACAENGTHYLDATGEVPWVAKMIRKYEATAKSNGSIMIPQIGIESAPADLITWSLASLIREELAAPTGEVILSLHEIVGTPSGGTLATILDFLDSNTLTEIQESMSPYALSPIPNPDYRKHWSLEESLIGVRTVSDLGTLTTSIARGADTPIVHRTWGLLGGPKTYGPNFIFSEYMRARNYFTGILLHVAFTVAPIFLLFRPLRMLIKRFVSAPGEGPDRARRERIEYRALATVDLGDSADSENSERAYCRASYEGGMYYLTGILLAEGALCILKDESKAKEMGGGVLTPATLGQNFIDRLGEAGFKFETEILDYETLDY